MSKPVDDVVDLIEDDVPENSVNSMFFIPLSGKKNQLEWKPMS